MKWSILFLSVAYGCLLENGMNSVYLSVFEDLKPGNVIGALPIQGSIAGEKPELSLKVVKGQQLVDLQPGSKNLQLKQPLDRDEGNTRFEAVVECRSTNADADFNQLNISVFVTVKDINDNAPEFDAKEYNISIKEELPVGTIVFTDFEATDKDQPGPNSFVQYSIVKGPFSDLLDIVDPFRPIVTVKNRIDYEKLKYFEVQLEARDQGEPSLFSRVPLRVTVENTNDLNPYFTNRYYTANKVKNGELVLEPSALRVIDADGLQAEIGFSLEGEHSSDFSIDKRGVIRSKTNPPPSRATLLVNAFEMENRERNTTAIVVVNLDSSLQFTHQAYSANVHQSTPPGTIILTVKAVSNRANDVITYSLSGHQGITIDEKFGKVSVVGPLKIGMHLVNITAATKTDSSMVPLTLQVDKSTSDCSENVIEFEKSEYNMQIGSIPVLGNVKVKNSDNVRYSLLNMNKEFAVDNEGVIRRKAGANPDCSICELILLAKQDDSGAQGLTKVLVKNTNYSISTGSVLTVLILILLTLIFSILLIYICKRVHYAWRSHKRTSICWMNNTNDTGITITGTLPTPSRYVVNSEKERGHYETSKSPAPKRAQGAHLVPVTVTNQDGAPTVYF